MNLLETIKNKVRSNLSNQESEIADAEDENIEETLDNVDSPAPKGIFKRVFGGAGDNSVFDVLAQASVDKAASEAPQEGAETPAESSGLGSMLGSMKDALSQRADQLKQAVSAQSDSASVEDTGESATEKVSSVLAVMKQTVSNGTHKLRDTVSSISQSDDPVDDSSNMTDTVEENNESNQTITSAQEDAENEQNQTETSNDTSVGAVATSAQGDIENSQDQTETSNDKSVGTVAIAGSALLGLKNVLSKGVDTIKDTAADSDMAASVLDSAKNALNKGTDAIKDATGNLTASGSVTGMAKNIVTKSTEAIHKGKAAFNASDSLADSAKNILNRSNKDQPESTSEKIEPDLNEAEQVTEEIIASTVETDAGEAVADQQVEEYTEERGQDSRIKRSMAEDSVINATEEKVDAAVDHATDLAADVEAVDDGFNNQTDNISQYSSMREVAANASVTETVLEAADELVIATDDTGLSPLPETPEKIADSPADRGTALSDADIIEPGLDEAEQVTEEIIASAVETDAGEVVADQQVEENTQERGQDSRMKRSMAEDSVINATEEKVDAAVDHATELAADVEAVDDGFNNETDNIPQYSPMGEVDASASVTETVLETADELVIATDDTGLSPVPETLEKITDSPADRGTVLSDADKTPAERAHSAMANDTVPSIAEPTIISTETIDVDRSAAWTVKDNKGVDSHPFAADPAGKSDVVSVDDSDKDELMAGYIPPLEKAKFRWVLPVVLLALLSLAFWLSVIKLKQNDVEVEEFAMLESTLETQPENPSVAQNSDLEADVSISTSADQTLTSESATTAVQGVYRSAATEDSEIISEVASLSDDPRAGVAVTEQVGEGALNAAVNSDSVVSPADNISDDLTAAEAGLVAMIESASLPAARGEQAGDILQKLQNNSPVEAIARFLQSNEGSLPTGFILYGLSFETASSLISEDSARIISDLAVTLEAYPNTSIRLEGHTDSRGNDEANKILSTSRANTVKAALLSLNLNPARITAVGLGEDYPIVDNATKAGQSQNRRVEVIITER